MITNNIRISTRIFAAVLTALLYCGCTENNSPDNLDYVDPNIGGVAYMLKPTYPTIQRPNQMIRMIPGRKDYLDDQIRFFPLHLIGHRTNGVLRIMPFTAGHNPGIVPVSSWDQEHETVRPYYYKVWLEDFDMDVEFSPGNKCGYFRFSYPRGSSKLLYLHALEKGEWKMNTEGILTATETVDGVTAYLHGEFNVGGTIENAGHRKGKGACLVQFTEGEQDPVEFRYAVSYIDGDQARKNLKAEISDWDFTGFREEARKSWTRVMNRIEVKGGTEAYRRSFYTALYRCYERMVDISEDKRYFSGYDGEVHTDERAFYNDDWVWDTYLAHHPLRLILDPEIEADMIASYLRMYEQSGWLPTFPQVKGDHPCMNGFHSTIVILDAWNKGIRDFDVDLAYEAMKNNALNATMLPWRNGPRCELDDFYHENGYYPALHPGETEIYTEVHPLERRQSVAVTLGHSYDDWALAQMAGELGHDEDYSFFMERAGWYKNLWWEEKGFFMPKDADGKWIDIDPAFGGGQGGRDYYDENNGWTYLWGVQHDIEGLMELMGGKSAFEERLDQLFREELGRTKFELLAKFPDFSGQVGQFSMGNEPSFHIPYLYNYTDSPWKTQKKIRMLLNTWFKDDIFGIPGDEDGGGMSAFVVFSAMGFYPVTPGIPMYEIGSPLFSEITIHLPDGKTFTISAPGCSEKNKYVQHAILNGVELTTPRFSHEDLMNGGVLELKLGPFPNKSWGVME